MKIYEFCLQEIVTNAVKGFQMESDLMIDIGS